MDYAQNGMDNVHAWESGELHLWPASAELEPKSA